MCADPGADRVWVEIDPTSQPISGVVHHGSEPARRFDGWLELVALLESERRTGSSPLAPPEPG
jgi:hypothetical protein